MSESGKFQDCDGDSLDRASSRRTVGDTGRVWQTVQQTIVRQAAAVHVTERADYGSEKTIDFAVEDVEQIVKRVH